MLKKTLFQEVPEVKDDKKGKIFHSMPTPVAKPEEKKPTPVVDESDDDWGAVPAFLRRSKLK